MRTLVHAFTGEFDMHINRGLDPKTFTTIAFAAKEEQVWDICCLFNCTTAGPFFAHTIKKQAHLGGKPDRPLKQSA